MERLENAFRLASWSLRRRFNLKNQTIAPIQWGQPTVIDEPSQKMSERLDEQKRRRLQQIREELLLFSRLTNRFPRSLSDRDWLILLECESRKQRLDHCNFLFGRERLKEADRVKKEQKREEREQMTRVERADDSCYLNWNTARAVSEERRRAWGRVSSSHRLPSPSLAVDCRFLPLMSPRGADLTAVQLQYLVAANRDRRNPWRLYFSNFDAQDARVKRLHDKHLQSISSASSCSPIVSSLNYTSIAPQQKIIYLSPHAEQELEEVNDDEVYVLGGIVDRVPEKGIDRHASRVAAEADGVLARKLPLDTYVKWESGTKYLTLVAVMSILQDVHESGGDWQYALQKNIPVRNTRPADAKNPMGREKHERIRQFNRQILRIVDKRLPFQ